MGGWDWDQSVQGAVPAVWIWMSGCVHCELLTCEQRPPVRAVCSGRSRQSALPRRLSDCFIFHAGPLLCWVLTAESADWI